MKIPLTAPLDATVDSRGRASAMAALPPADAMFEEIVGHPAHLLRRAYQIFSSLFDEELGKKDGLTPGQFIILVMLYARPGIDMSALSGLAAIDKTSCGRSVEKLAAKGLVRIALDQRDRRQRYPTLTVEGVGALQMIWPGVARMRERLLAGLNPALHDAFIDLLKAFVEVKNEESRAPHRRR